MGASRFVVLLAGIGLSAASILLAQCSPETLVYEPTGGKDGSAGTIGVGGGNTWAEICGNGIDDNHNGKTDCEDPACPNYACVDLPPAGWKGPVALYQGKPGSLAKCAAGLSDVYDGNADLGYSAAQCSACSCGSPASSSCDVGVSYYADAACSSLISTYSVSGSCSAADGSTTASVNITISTSGSCGAGTAPTPFTTPPTWKLAARACALSSGPGQGAGCASGKVCAPLSSDALACVYQTGDVDCPAGYPARHVFYGSFDDSRDCGGCSCTYADDGCSASVTGFADTACTMLNLQTSSTGCNATGVHSATASGANVINARCDASTSAPTGCVAPATPTTLCCSNYAGTPCPSGGGPAMVQVPTAGGDSFCIDSTEVTKKQYAAFIASNPSTAGQPAVCAWNTSFAPLSSGGADDTPVTTVDWCDAFAFCAWAGKRLCGKIGGGALQTSVASDATQSQWYDACTAGGTRKYPYGDEPMPDACGSSDPPDPVKSYPCCQGGYPGIFDLVGNAQEWIDGCQIITSSGDHDQCLLGGQSSCSSTKASRNRHQQDIGFRCCAP